MSNPIKTIEDLDAVLHWRNKHAIVIKERDALQLRLNEADQRIDELTAAEQRNAELAEVLSYVHDVYLAHLTVATRQAIRAALKPTESGASE